MAEAVVAAVVAERLPLLVQPLVLVVRAAPEARLLGDLALPHKLLHLVRLQVAVVRAVRPAPLPQQPEVAEVVVLVQGLVASEIFRRR